MRTLPHVLRTKLGSDGFKLWQQDVVDASSRGCSVTLVKRLVHNAASHALHTSDVVNHARPREPTNTTQKRTLWGKKCCGTGHLYSIENHPSQPYPGFSNGRKFLNTAPAPAKNHQGLHQSSNEDDDSADAEEWRLEYQGSLSNTIRTLKMVSLTTAGLSLVGSPIYIMATMDGQYTAVKVMAASGFTCFGLFTTGLLHWFISPYVHKLWYKESTKQVKVEMRSLFLQPEQLVFHENDVTAPDSIAPLQTFEASGRVMFIDDSGFENKDLLQTLTPPSPYDMGQEEEKKDISHSTRNE